MKSEGNLFLPGHRKIVFFFQQEVKRIRKRCGFLRTNGDGVRRIVNGGDITRTGSHFVTIIRQTRKGKTNRQG